MGYFVYIITSQKDSSFYIGQTNDINDRLNRHNAGQERYTKTKVPWKLFWYIDVPSRSEAMRLERKIKNLKSRKRIMEFIHGIGHSSINPLRSFILNKAYFIARYNKAYAKLAWSRIV